MSKKGELSCCKKQAKTIIKGGAILDATYRQIRAIHNDKTIRVYQAYNDEIADAALAANSFRGPLNAGCWSKTRMTWIKPSKVWMAYRSGFTLLKDKNQSRILALDLSRSQFEHLLMQAKLSSHHEEETSKGEHQHNDTSCRNSNVVVQWDPERVMTPVDGAAEHKNVFTSRLQDIRSIQIGLRGTSVEALLDPELVVKITDVTPDFRNALSALQNGNVEEANSALWPDGITEENVHLPLEVMKVLGMRSKQTDEKEEENADAVTKSKPKK